MTHVILGISGSISAYKTPDIVRLFRKEGWDVTPILTQQATQFVSPLSLETVAETPCLTPQTFMSPEIPHLKLAKSADIVVGAPLSANTLAKIASGRADDPVSAILSAFCGPVILSPAMHTEMWEHPKTQEALTGCQTQTTTVVGPDHGALASGDYGTGRLVDPRLLVLAVYAGLSGMPRLDGCSIVITAGGTVEPIDPVRHITNSSTGLSGETLAHMASLLGATVTLISSRPLQIPNPHIQAVVPVQTVSDLQAALDTALPGADRLYMAAAVSDFTVMPSSEKLSRSQDMTLQLSKTADILKSLKRSETTTYIGFCLSDGDLETIAKKKLSDKNLDYIVANRPDQVGATHRTATIYGKDATAIPIQEATLAQYALELLKLS